MLMGGKSAHHNKIKNMAMRLPDGRLTKNAAENISVMYPHFQRVLNNHRPTNFTILELVPQQGTMWELNDPITWDEFLRIVRKLKKGKVAGLTNVPPEAFKVSLMGIVPRSSISSMPFLKAAQTTKNGIVANVFQYQTAET